MEFFVLKIGSNSTLESSPLDLMYLLFLKEEASNLVSPLHLFDNLSTFM